MIEWWLYDEFHPYFQHVSKCYDFMGSNVCLQIICYIRSLGRSLRDQPNQPQPQRNETHVINTVSMVATSRGTTEGNANPTNVPNTLPSYPIGVNPMAPPNLYSKEPTRTAAMPGKSPLPPDTVDPPHHPHVHAAGMAVAPADMPPKYSDLF